MLTDVDIPMCMPPTEHGTRQPGRRHPQVRSRGEPPCDETENVPSQPLSSKEVDGGGHGVSAEVFVMIAFRRIRLDVQSDVGV